MKKNRKKVYVTLAIDFLHKGHLKILKIANKYGDVIVGLLTDKAIIKYKPLPNLDYKSREILIKNIKYVKKVIPQDSEDYTYNLNLIKPDYLVHGDDWNYDNRKSIRTKAIKTLKKWSGKLIEPKYSKDISDEFQKEKIKKFNQKNDNRISKLSRLIKSKDIVRVLESHNSLTGLIIENLNIKTIELVFSFNFHHLLLYEKYFFN